MSTRWIFRLLDFLIAVIFIVAGLTKILNMDQLVTDAVHWRLVDLLRDIKHVSLSDPVGFVRDIDNYKILPWPAAVALGFFLPWLEVFCGLALITRRLYRGAMWILCSLTIVFIMASIVAKSRGLD
ncbi:MAG TPA: MauE/DoxX family redox-associated membrane protein, partial [Chthoniobacterales bacterium]